MREQVDSHYVAAQIRLLRQVHKGTILLVEGSTDAKLFGKFVDVSACNIEVGFGKENVLGAIDLLEEEGLSGIVGIADADFDRILGVSCTLENLFFTDAHDLDLTIFLSSSLDNYLAEYGDQARIRASFEGGVNAIRVKILKACEPISCCRLASVKRNLRINFGDINYEELVDKNTLKVDRLAMLKVLLTRSNASCSEVELEKLVEAEIKKNHDPQQLAMGHDVAAVFGIALRKMLADRRDVHTWSREIEAGLRLAFDWSALTATIIYQQLRRWESNNIPFRIFSA